MLIHSALIVKCTDFEDKMPQFGTYLKRNPLHHSYRQAANCARCGAFVKGVDTDKNQNKIGTRLALDKRFATGLPLALAVKWFHYHFKSICPFDVVVWASLPKGFILQKWLKLHEAFGRVCSSTITYVKKSIL